MRALAATYESYAWPAPLAAPQGRTVAYRNRARMLVTEDGAALGFYRAGTREIEPVATCAVHEPAVEAALDRVRAVAPLPDVSYVDVRANADGKSIVTLGVEQRPSEARLAELAQIADGTTSVHLNIGTKGAMLAGRQEVVSGDASLVMSVDSKQFDVPPTAFFQVNTEVLEQMHGVVRPWVSAADEIWDLYCGVGVHGIACAGTEQRVNGSDIEASALQAAAVNADRNGVRATYVESADTAFERPAPEQPGATASAVLNPARAGLAWDLPTKLGTAAAVGRVAYISCEPATFFRDAERLHNEGLQLAHLHAFDMMPRTDHVELAGLFERHDAPRRWENLGHGVTGAAAAEGPDIFIALIVGAVAKRATLPGGVITVEKIRSVEDASVVRLVAPRSIDPEMLRATLRRWSFPVVGDSRFGRRSSNFRWARDFALDVPALHRVASGDNRAAVPAFLLSLLRIPRKVAEQTAPR